MVAYSNKGTAKTKEIRGKCVLGLWSEFPDDFMEHDPENEAERIFVLKDIPFTS